MGTCNMASYASQAAKGAGKKQISQEQIISGFNEMRNSQRAVVGKISELEDERKEHDLVIDALKEVDGDRKCFRMVGGVLVERTVKEVLPALQTNHEQLGKVVEAMNAQLEAKGKAINDYRQKHNIRVRGDEEKPQAAQPEAKSSGVLVSKDAS